MWLKWLPWKYMIRTVARRRGFIDPISILARFNSVSQPTQTVAPLELLRAGMVLHARGFINNNVIQHNLDWVWPLWVERQFDPENPAFIPRAFSLTHINLTQRNWTAIGYPGCPETPIVDACGLLMPFFDSWSVDAWFIADSGEALIPSRRLDVRQRLETEGNLRVVTEVSANGMHLRMQAEVEVEERKPECRLNYRASSEKPGWLVVSLRPYNPEGISFINDLSLLSHDRGWEINKEQEIRFSREPEEHLLSRYRDGDVFLSIRNRDFNRKPHVLCDVGMATGAILYRVEAGGETETSLTIPLSAQPDAEKSAFTAGEKWQTALSGGAAIAGGTDRTRFLFDSALRTVLLLSPREIYAGPYTYKRFWFRDAAIILHSLICLGYRTVAERALDYFVSRQSHNGYFMSQDGEWDSNGQVLWVMGRYCRLFHTAPKPEWIRSIRKAVHWIRHKREGEKPGKRHGGLLPAGFSAEHLGPNDFYYWDDFWSIAGLRLAEEMLWQSGEHDSAEEAKEQADSLSLAVDRSLKQVKEKIGTEAMPASPYRRMDSGAVGSVAVGFPLQLWSPQDPRLLETVAFLRKHCQVRGAFYHDINHSGINPYLSLHIAQCLLRAGDPDFRVVMDAIDGLASETGQWPEAIHSHLGTGCMGDGEHAWAAAEWLMMVRNCFFFEEEYEEKVVVAAGLSSDWCGDSGRVEFGPAPTRFGPVMVSLERHGMELELKWSGNWFEKAPSVEVKLPMEDLELISKAEGKWVYLRSLPLARRLISGLGGRRDFEGNGTTIPNGIQGLEP